MGHNHGSDYKEWLDKKEKEERLLRQLGVDEGTIQILRNYDYRLFLDDRRFTDHERATSEGLFLMVPAYDPVIIATRSMQINSDPETSKNHAFFPEKKGRKCPKSFQNHPCFQPVFNFSLFSPF